MGTSTRTTTSSSTHHPIPHPIGDTGGYGDGYPSPWWYLPSWGGPHMVVSRGTHSRGVLNAEIGSTINGAYVDVITHIRGRYHGTPYPTTTMRSTMVYHDTLSTTVSPVSPMRGIRGMVVGMVLLLVVVWGWGHNRGRCSSRGITPKRCHYGPWYW
jgi:hypothetical protein